MTIRTQTDYCFATTREEFHAQETLGLPAKKKGYFGPLCMEPIGLRILQSVCGRQLLADRSVVPLRRILDAARDKSAIFEAKARS